MAKKPAKAKVVKDTALDLAEKLADVRSRMAIDKRLNDALTVEFKKALKKEGLTKAGNYRLEQSNVYKVALEELALPFALQRNLVKVDTSKIREVFRLDNELRFKDPTEFGFAVSTVEKVSPIRGSDD